MSAHVLYRRTGSHFAGTCASASAGLPVAEKIERVHREVGGFGVLLVFGFDYRHNPEAWRHSQRLLAKEVLPRVKHLTPAMTRAA